MKRITAILGLASLILMVAGPAWGFDYTAYRLVWYGADGQEGGGDDQIQMTQPGHFGLTSGTESTARIAYSQADKVYKWSLANGYQTATAPDDYGSPVVTGNPYVGGINDSDYIGVVDSDNNETYFYDDSSGWGWVTGPAGGSARVGLAAQGVGNSTAICEAGGETYSYNFDGSADQITGPGSYMLVAAANNNDEYLSWKYSSGEAVKLYTGGSWQTVSTTMDRVYDVNDSRVIIGEYTGTKVGYAYDYDSSTEYAIPFMTYDRSNHVEPPNFVTADSCVPTAINNNGLVTGYQYESTVGDSIAHGFVWDSNNPTADPLDIGSAPVTDLSDVVGLPAYGNSVIWHPSDINDQGLITARAQQTSYMILLVPTDAPPPLYNRGDVTEDDFVGADDLVRILTHWGESGAGVTWADGDCAPYGDGSAPGDDFIGADDYVEVLTYWGSDYSTPEPAPEPATIGLLVIGGLALLHRRA